MDMNLLNIGASAEGKMRIIQETVPGKQVTLAHIIASPGEIIYQKLGLNPELDYKQSAIGILSMCPSEISVIAGDIAMKTAPIEIGFIDRFSGTLIFTGRISNVQSAVANILAYLKNNLGFTVCEITRT
ncbi:BMC domain-containing protein [Petralouisia muris]|jgi:ethanolamine utilization protein EutS|nr:BMC domain-containing protein [Petralouisia muris]